MRWRRHPLGRGAPSQSLRALPLSALSPKAAARARALPPGPCLLQLQPEDASRPPLTLPARRLREPEALRVLLRFTAGLEFRPKAVVHALGFRLGLNAGAPLAAAQSVA